MIIPGTTPEPASNGWLVRTPGSGIPRLRLFCFPYAGKGAAIFARWSSLLPPDIEVCALQLPGKGGLLREKPTVSLREVVQEIAQVLDPWLDIPFALLGHSLGSLLAFEVVREIRLGRGIEAVRLFVSGQAAPHRMPTSAGLHLMDDEEMLAEIATRYGAIPPAVRQDRDLMKLLLPGLRADLTMLETYRYEPGEALHCPISAFAGDRDTAASIESVRSWRDQTTGHFRMRVLVGDHFFIESRRADFLSAVALDCSPGQFDGGKA